MDRPDPVLRNRDIVVIGLQPWYYDIGSNCKNIATQFARHNRVLYVNLPINRKTYFSGNKNEGVQKHVDVIQGKGPRIQPIRENMWEFYPTTIVESINAIPVNAAFQTINYFNNRRFARNIRQAVQELGFRDIILFNDNDIYNGFFLKELLRPSIYVYYMRDFLQGMDYWRRHVSILEPKLIKKADVAVANSMYLADYCAEHNPRSYYIGQGCSFEYFDAGRAFAKPVELERLATSGGRGDAGGSVGSAALSAGSTSGSGSSPIVGYVGAIDARRLDEAILDHIARERPGWNIVMVGPEDDVFKNSSLHRYSNIHWVGRKNMAELPAFVAHFDVCMNPQLNNIVTKGNYPLKIDEYLALGKPVVATRTSTMRLFEDHTYLADAPADYVGLIERALREDSAAERERRIAFARSHTWENSMLELYKVIGGATKNPLS